MTTFYWQCSSCDACAEGPDPEVVSNSGRLHYNHTGHFKAKYWTNMPDGEISDI